MAYINKEEEQLIKNEWKEKEVDRAEFEFSCGGDSMNDTTLTIYNSIGDISEGFKYLQELENLIYDNISFYENSDGHYQGESGTVIIALNEEDEFEFDKQSESEYEEQEIVEIDVQLSKEERKYIIDNISSFHYSTGNESQFDVNYKREFIQTNEDEIIENLAFNKIREQVLLNPTEFEGDVSDYFEFGCDDIIEDFKVEIRYTVSTHSPSNN